MPVLTDQSSAEVRRTTKRLYGTLIKPPAILVSDGMNEVWVADVNIGPRDPTGEIQQYLNEKNGKFDSTKDLITGLPNQNPEDWQLDDSLPANLAGTGGIDTTLHNVVVAKNNLDIIYADVGSPVVCERDETGLWQITGFSMERPGTHKLYPVDLGDISPMGFEEDPYGISGWVSGDASGPGQPPRSPVGGVIDLTIEARLLTLAELGTYRPFGALPFGTGALFKGGKLLRIV